MAGLPLFVVRQTDEIDYFKNEIETMLNSILSTIELKEKGVYVQASTLGSLEALLQLLKSYNIPVKILLLSKIIQKEGIFSFLVFRSEYWTCTSKRCYESISTT